MELISGGLRGWQVGSFCATRNGKHMGVVLRVHEQGVDILWDDNQIGHLLWDIERPNNIDTAKLLGLYGNKSLRDFFGTPYADLWRAVYQHICHETFPRTEPTTISTGMYINAL